MATARRVAALQLQVLPPGYSEYLEEFSVLAAVLYPGACPETPEYWVSSVSSWDEEEDPSLPAYVAYIARRRALPGTPLPRKEWDVMSWFLDHIGEVEIEQLVGVVPTVEIKIGQLVGASSSLRTTPVIASGTSLICLDCGVGFVVGKYIQDRLANGTYLEPPKR